MTDIVERLRNASVYEQYKAVLSNLGDEAADEIERLRERLGPVGLEVVEIDSSGHYVNVKVKAEIERLRAKEKDWTEMFEAQKSIIGRLTDTLREIKRENQHYNFGSKLVRIVDTALKVVP